MSKKIIIFGLLATVVVLIPLHFTHAGVGDLAVNSIISIVAWGAKTMLFIIGYVFSWGVYMGGLLLNWVLELNSDIVGNPVVNTGWTLSRDIVNMGFVLLIIIIAFSTILRLGSFQLKKALPKLIIAALLINFSILIATVLLDVAGIFTSYFLNSSYGSSSPGGISQAISGSLSLGSFLQTPSIAEDLTTFSEDTVKMIANLVFVDIMTAIGAITMITMALMFLIRYVAIGILLILMPAAILMWVIGNSQWGKWLDSFFKYTFFGPIAGFFIYIALKSATSFHTLSTSKFIIGTEGDINEIYELVGNIGSSIMMVALLMGGLIVAEKMSIMGAKGGVAAAKGAWKGILKGTASTGFSMLRGKWASEKLSKFGATYKSPILRGLTRPLRQMGASGQDFHKNYGGGLGIFTATSEGISEGLGFKARKFRLKEEKEWKEKEEKETKKEAKKKAKTEKISLQETEFEKLNDQLATMKEAKKKAKTEKISLQETEFEKLNDQLATINSNIQQEKLKPNINQVKIDGLQTDAKNITDQIKTKHEAVEKIKQEPEEENEIINITDQIKTKREAIEKIKQEPEEENEMMEELKKIKEKVSETEEKKKEEKEST